MMKEIRKTPQGVQMLSPTMIQKRFFIGKVMKMLQSGVDARLPRIRMIGIKFPLDSNFKIRLGPLRPALSKQGFFLNFKG